MSTVCQERDAFACTRRHQAVGFPPSPRVVTSVDICQALFLNPKP